MHTNYSFFPVEIKQLILTNPKLDLKCSEVSRILADTRIQSRLKEWMNINKNFADHSPMIQEIRRRIDEINSPHLKNQSLSKIMNTVSQFVSTNFIQYFYSADIHEEIEKIAKTNLLQNKIKLKELIKNSQEDGMELLKNYNEIGLIPTYIYEDLLFLMREDREITSTGKVEIEEIKNQENNPDLTLDDDSLKQFEEIQTQKEENRPEETQTLVEETLTQQDDIDVDLSKVEQPSIKEELKSSNLDNFIRYNCLGSNKIIYKLVEKALDLHKDTEFKSEFQVHVIFGGKNLLLVIDFNEKQQIQDVHLLSSMSLNRRYLNPPNAKEYHDFLKKIPFKLNVNNDEVSIVKIENKKNEIPKYIIFENQQFQLSEELISGLSGKRDSDHLIGLDRLNNCLRIINKSKELKKLSNSEKNEELTLYFQSPIRILEIVVKWYPKDQYFEKMNLIIHTAFFASDSYIKRQLNISETAFEIWKSKLKKIN